LCSKEDIDRAGIKPEDIDDEYIGNILSEGQGQNIAKLVIEGRYIESYISEGVYAELRIATANRNRLVKDLNGLKNRIERWLKIYFPEDILKLEAKGINQLWRDRKIRAVGMKRAEELYSSAKRSIGRKTGIRIDRMEISMLLEEYQRKTDQLDELLEIIDALCLEIPEIGKILKIKGVGLVSVAVFFAEVGDIRRFKSPKQIQKLAGLVIKENRAGKHNGQTGISKRGRKRLRAILFQVIMPLVAKNEQFKKIHRYYTTRKLNPLKKKQSLIALCCKLIRVLFGICTKGFDYDGNKMISDIKRPAALMAA
jgi:transposase